MKNKLDIKKERLAIGYTQAKLAQELGVTEKSVSKWESGRGEPSFENLQKMCIIFNKNINNECCELRKKKRMFFALRVAIAALSFTCFLLDLLYIIRSIYHYDYMIIFGELHYAAYNINISDYIFATLTLSTVSLIFTISSCFEFKSKELYLVFYLITIFCSIIGLAFVGNTFLSKCLLAIQLSFILFLFYLYVIEKKKKGEL